MQMISLYQTKLGCKDEDAVFEYFTKTLKDKLLTWSYFVNWEKVFDHVKELELDLNQLNYLIGKPDFDEAFLYLLRHNPEVARSLPALVVRDGGNTKRFQILVDYANKKLVYEDFDFVKANISEDDIHRYLEFV